MAKAAHALSAPISGRNPSPALYPETAALQHEWRAAFCVWAALPPGSSKESKVCRQILELQARLGMLDSLATREVRHV
jgi:hypothetical protein